MVTPSAESSTSTGAGATPAAPPVAAH
ncbi:MAG: hypothetical protein JWP97_3262, partial [Labilithrix sp.]|nr:hypothetical protein [Labilithrix sp.]